MGTLDGATPLDGPAAQGDGPGSNGGDAGSGGDGTAGPIEAGACGATFCDDFDEGGVGEKWSEARQTNGQIVFDENAAISPPRSLRTTIGSASGLYTRRALLRRELPLGRAVRCTAAVRVNSTGSPAHHVDFFQINATAADITRYDVRLFIRGSTSAIRDDVELTDGGCSCPNKTTTFTPIARTKWTSVTMETDFKEVSVSYDGTLAFKGPFGDGLTPKSLAVTIGINSYDMGAWDVQYDDLRCDVLP